MERKMLTKGTWNRECLIKTLLPIYEMHLVDGPHDANHPYRMMQIGKELKGCLSFCYQEFVATAWLHNLDRAKTLYSQLSAMGFTAVCYKYLDGSPFETDTRERIVGAVIHHAKLDGPDDSSLLTALRSADRLDWLGPIGIAAASYAWTAHGLYSGVNPFADTCNPFALAQRGMP